MCNCGKKRAAAAGGGGGPPRAPVAVPVPAPTSAPVRSRIQQRVVPVRATPAPAPPPELPIVDPALWGPHLWRFLHIAAENTVPRMSRRRYWEALLTAMRTGLPCPECTEHYVAWHTGHPFAVDRRVGLTVAARDWVRALHNAVNVRRGVAEWTPEAVTAAYGGATGGGRAGARAALDAAAAAGVGPGVIAAGRALLDRVVR
jgi:hypothetical protein